MLVVLGVTGVEPVVIKQRSLMHACSHGLFCGMSIGASEYVPSQLHSSVCAEAVCVMTNNTVTKRRNSNCIAEVNEKCFDMFVTD